MWKYWYQLTIGQQQQARDLDAEVRKDPSIYLYYVNREGKGDVTGYITAIGYDNLGVK